mmetsp:Transcript_32260/g.23812  ORF Transcript_32260/g.23812 Transcript_32260/m.23812 type:complete len:117 (+) Transcript_32260:452-802(+)
MNSACCESASQFVRENFSGVCLEERAGVDYSRMVLAECSDVAKEPLFGFDANACTLYFKQVPVNISRSELLEVIKQNKGFTSLSLSEPLKSQNFSRYAWVSFDSEPNCLSALEQLK